MTNTVITDSKIGYEAARQSLNATNYMEVKASKMYITLGFGQTDLMKNIRVIVNDKSVSYTTLNKNASKNTMDIKFEVPNLKSNVVIKSYIPAIEQDISFGIGFIEDSVVKISEGSVSIPLGTQVSNSSLAGMTASLQEDTDNDNQESNTDKDINNNLNDKYIKRYSIENDVIHNSAIGKKMARKYLYKISYIDEDDSNQKYLTITFSGTSVMDNFKIKVNNQDVEFEIVDHADGVKSFRFKIDAIDDDIQFLMYIKPVKMNINFKIKLLEETMKLVDEKEVAPESIVNDSIVEKVDVFKIALTTSIMTTIMVSTVFLISYKLYIKKQRK